MMLKNKKTSLMMSALALIVASSAVAFAAGHNHELCEGFIPQNDMKIPVGVKGGNRWSKKAAGGITEAQFNEVMTALSVSTLQLSLKKAANLKSTANGLTQL